MEKIKARLDYLRGEIEAQRISYEEIAELQSLAQYIEKDDLTLLQWADVCPHEDDIEFGKTAELEDGKYLIHNIMCANCHRVGTQIEVKDEQYPEQYNFVDENWHAPRDYYNSKIATGKVIKMVEA